MTFLSTASLCSKIVMRMLKFSSLNYHSLDSTSMCTTNWKMTLVVNPRNWQEVKPRSSSLISC